MPLYDHPQGLHMCHYLPYAGNCHAALAQKQESHLACISGRYARLLGRLTSWGAVCRVGRVLGDSLRTRCAVRAHLHRLFAAARNKS